MIFLWMSLAFAGATSNIICSCRGRPLSWSFSTKSVRGRLFNIHIALLRFLCGHKDKGLLGSSFLHLSNTGCSIFAACILACGQFPSLHKWSTEILLLSASMAQPGFCKSSRRSSRNNLFHILSHNRYSVWVRRHANKSLRSSGTSVFEEKVAFRRL